MTGKEDCPRDYRLEDKKLEIAPRERVVSFLEQIAQPVIHGQKPRQVLMANLLKDGERGPLVEGQGLVGAIEGPNGWEKVRDNGWTSAMEVFLRDQLDCDYDGILEGGGIQTECFMRDDRLRQETRLSAKGTGIYLLRVEEYNPDGAIELLGIEICNLENQPAKGKS